MSNLVAFEYRGMRFRPRLDGALREGWPIAACTGAMPLMFLLGTHGLVWALPGVVLGWRLLRRPTARVPVTALALAVALVWMLASAASVKPGGMPLFAYRWTLFLGALASEVYILNTPERVLPTRRIVRWLAALWITMVVFGLIAVVYPLDMKSPMQMGLGPIGNIEFFDSISAWRLAEVQGFLGFPLPRPSAPFPAANGWGSAMGLLFPIFVRAWIVEAKGGRRVLGQILAAVSIIPVIYSFNRGLWASMALSMLVLAFRQAISGRVKALLAVAAGGLVALLLISFTPLGGLAETKVDTAEDSNEARGTVYDEALSGAKESPLIGNGAPRKISDDLPPVGTHGMIWYLIFVHGFVTAILYCIWLASETLASAPSRSPGSLWFHLVLVVAAVQTLIYGMLPQVVIVGMVAGLARREAQSWRDRNKVEVPGLDSLAPSRRAILGA
jgi:hypothetical protein